MNSDQIKTAAEHLQHGADLKFQEAREWRGRAEKARSEAEAATKQVDLLEGQARSLLAAADELERRR